MTHLQYDLAFIEAGVGELEQYLLAKTTYWPIGITAPFGFPPYPHFTLGWLLLFSMRAGAYPASGEEKHRLEAALRAIGMVRSQWSTAWERKTTGEFHARLTLWRNFLEDYRQDEAEHADRYPYEVNRRAMLFLLQAESQAIIPAELELLDGLDKYLEAVFVEGKFVWDAHLQKAFPPEAFWFLYGTLRT